MTTSSTASQDEYYPRRAWPKYCVELFFAFIFYVPMAALTLLCGVPLLPFVALVRWQRSRYKPWRSPREVRVAIVGGGWSGLQLAARFQELGVAWQGFEANDNFGGTWHPKGRYDGLALHTAAWLAAFADYPFATSSSDAYKNDQRPSGAEMQQYLERFADEHDLRRGFFLSLIHI